MSSPAQRLLRAARYAAEQHRAQRRKGRGDHSARTPYVNHVLAVADEIAQSGIDDTDILCAALLHDTIEDTDSTEADLRRLFGDRVTGLVLEVSDNKALPKAERKRLQIEHARHASPGAAHVKLADKICNVRDLLIDPPDWPIERIREYFDWALEVITGVRGHNPTLEARFDKLYAQRP